MADIISLHGDPHETAQRLLPWYLTQTLDAADYALVEIHLAVCAECRADLASEQRLRDALTAEDAPTSAQWSALRERATQGGPRPTVAQPAGWSVARWAMLIAASQAAFFLVGIGATRWIYPQESRITYHALSASPSRRTGNIIVMFKPDMTEGRLRAVLNGFGARLTDGPTAAGAYVLSVPGAQREAVLGGLQQRPDILLAQPLDGPRP